MRFSSSDHQRKAEHNRSFVVAVGQLADPYLDWQITAIFYTAVHILQAYFTARTQVYPTKHEERDHQVQGDPFLQGIWRDYRELKTLSVTSRYECLPINDHDVSEAQRHLEVISQHVMTLLKPPAK